MMTSSNAFDPQSPFYPTPYMADHSTIEMEVASKMMPSACHPTSSIRQQQAVIVSRCEAPLSDASATTSTSSSPTSAASTTPPQQCRKPDVTNEMINGMKVEPMESIEFAQQSIYRQVHIGYGVRCSSTDDNSNPTSSHGGRIQMNMRRSRSSQDGFLKCQFCPKKAIDSASLDMHMQDCRLIRSHECPQCGKRFKARGGLQQHMRIHNNERPYTCKFCTKRFTQKSHVDQHERIHTGMKPFNCHICGRSFRQRSQQMGHEATHTTSTANDDRNALTLSNTSTSSPTMSRPTRSSAQSIEHHLNDGLSIFGPSTSTVTSLLALSQSTHALNDQHMLTLGHHHLNPTINNFNHHNMPQALLNQMR